MIYYIQFHDERGSLRHSEYSNHKFFNFFPAVEIQTHEEKKKTVERYSFSKSIPLILPRDFFVGIDDFWIISCQFNGNNVHHVLNDASIKNNILERFRFYEYLLVQLIAPKYLEKFSDEGNWS